MNYDKMTLGRDGSGAAGQRDRGVGSDMHLNATIRARPVHSDNPIHILQRLAQGGAGDRRAALAWHARL